MKISVKKIVSLIIFFMIMSSFVFAQDYPTGGYQGGLYGNVKIKTWSGTSGPDWGDATNWCPPGVPGERDDVMIPETAVEMPEITQPEMSCNDLTIKDGATLSIAPGVRLTVNGEMTIKEE